MFSATEIYSPSDKRLQRDERARRLRSTRSDWLATVEDVQFEHDHLGVSAIEFSGDLRPDHEHQPGYRCPRCGHLEPRQFWLHPAIS